eukprot:CAMPEP_0184673094 /NCGR_PEP_ID=MMETSP0308-20130426/86484_1 /TAXON_ID=38269 /ORGANISM="Gloeochaete witrockiana, Strain SAG 46.84" /LENGTH=295 /DNA_ID=CAMNT_0027120543 /DNA_START=233 /DNA_END=1120 /DNA_ORIENTATION=+
MILLVSTCLMLLFVTDNSVGGVSVFAVSSTAFSSVDNLMQRDISAFTKDCIRGGMFPIEELNAELDFRPDWAANTSYVNVEDRSYLLPFLLGDKVDTKKFSRRVYVDIGSNIWVSSYKWQLEHNPVEFDEYHLFEARFLPQLPSNRKLGNVYLNSPARKQRHFPKSDKTPDEIGASIRKKTFIHQAFVALNDDVTTSPKSLNITKYLLEVVRIQEKGTYVTIKFDIEGAEWSIIPSWEKGGIFDYIHEMFMEVHYGDSPRLTKHGWDHFLPHKRQHAEAMFNRLRKLGVHAHAWP